MIVMKVINDNTIEVIHYSSPSEEADGRVIVNSFLSISGQSSGSGPIATVRIDRVVYSTDQLSTLERITYPFNDPVFLDPVDRGQQRLHEATYSVFYNNCESFANWCLIGRNVTPQGKYANFLLIFTVYSVFVCIAIALLLLNMQN